MLDTIAMAKRLNGEYKTAFEKIEIYGLAEGGAVENHEEKMMEIFDILLEAQNENKPIEKIVGKDLEIFCKNFFEEKVVEENNKILVYIFRVMMCSFTYGILDILINLDGLNRKTDIYPLLGGVLMGGLILIIKKYLVKKSLKNKKVSPTNYSLILMIMCWMAYPISFRFFQGLIKVSTFGLLVISGVYIIFYVGYYYIWNKKIFKTITVRNMKKEKNKEMRKFNEEIRIAETKEDMVNRLVKRYKKINIKNNKKGKPEITFKQFSENTRKKYQENIVINIICIVISIVLILYQSVPKIKENLIGGIIYLFILSIATIFIYKEVVKITKEVSGVTLEILNECEEQGIDINEYVERLKK